MTNPCIVTLHASIQPLFFYSQNMESNKPTTQRKTNPIIGPRRKKKKKKAQKFCFTIILF